MRVVSLEQLERSARLMPRLRLGLPWPRTALLRLLPTFEPGTRRRSGALMPRTMSSWRNSSRILLYWLATLSIPLRAAAEEKPTIQCVDDDPLRCTVHLKAYAVAPYEGILYSPRLAAEESVKAGQCDRHTSVEVTAVRAESKVRLDGVELKRQIQIEGCKWENKIVWRKYEGEVDRAPPKWAYVAGGFVGGALLMYLAAQAMR